MGIVEVIVRMILLTTDHDSDTNPGLIMHQESIDIADCVILVFIPVMNMTLRP